MAERVGRDGRAVGPPFSFDNYVLVWDDVWQVTRIQYDGDRGWSYAIAPVQKSELVRGRT